MANWKPIPSTLGYEASDKGEIRRVGAAAPLKAIFIPDGYYVVSVKTAKGTYAQRRVHRLVTEAFHGPAPTPKHEAAHGDGVRTNNAASNLRWATKVENQRDRLAHGTHSRGERASDAKFTNDEAAALRADLDAGRITRRQAATQYGVSYETIRALHAGETYA